MKQIARRLERLEDRRAQRASDDLHNMTDAELIAEYRKCMEAVGFEWSSYVADPVAAIREWQRRAGDDPEVQALFEELLANESQLNLGAFVAAAQTR
ncbi:hypothetical protein [Nioella aestuarii]|uniref:hypothetical protein n=1 Tax=Nioella aestuarii TaxID=1662864 RepID=UPI003D7F893E